jgi:hypothetical protein
MHKLWNDYLKNVNPIYNDLIKCSREKIRLSEVY